jgi:hypothetical protein
MDGTAAKLMHTVYNNHLACRLNGKLNENGDIFTWEKDPELCQAFATRVIDPNCVNIILIEYYLVETINIRRLLPTCMTSHAKH